MEWRNSNKIIFVVICIIFAALLAYLALDTYYQWDFKVYYYGAALDASGGNPYNHTALKRYSGAEGILPYLYPPVVLYIFRIFTVLPFNVANILWVCLKAACLMLLLYIWCRKFLNKEKCWLVFLFAFFAFGSALFLDFKAGNIAVIIQLLLWSGFYLLLNDKPILFCLMIIAASLFKLTPILFLILLPLIIGRRGFKYLISGFLGFVLIMMVDYFAEHADFMNWLKVLAMPEERGAAFNPTFLAFSKDIGRILRHTLLGKIVPSGFPWMIYLAMIAIIAFIVFRYIPWQKFRTAKHGRIEMIYMSCFIYAMIMPRFKTYSLILLIPPALYVIRKYSGKLYFPLMIILVSLSTRPPLPKLYLVDLFWTYYPLLIIYALWLIWVFFLNSGSEQTETPRAEAVDSRPQ
jgi:hypothetical protein